MGERTDHRPGTFSWVDLATTDTDGAKQFYSGLFGWRTSDDPIPGGGTYTMCRLEGRNVAAMSSQQDQEREQGIPPHWNSYVTVASADEAAARATELGGHVLAGPFDVMEEGRMAVLADPAGAAFSVWEPRNSIGAQLVNEPGCLTWNDLNTNDTAAAREFYGELFGWEFERAPTEEVEYWIIRNGDRTNGGVMQVQQQGMPSVWLPYFAVADVDATREQAEAAGAATLSGPMDVPNGRFCVLRDPQSAVFAVFSGEFDD
jgi:predicted enzyme related to lactoylglutathione lyase